MSKEGGFRITAKGIVYSVLKDYLPKDEANALVNRLGEEMIAHVIHWHDLDKAKVFEAIMRKEGWKEESA